MRANGFQTLALIQSRILLVDFIVRSPFPSVCRFSSFLIPHSDFPPPSDSTLHLSAQFSTCRSCTPADAEPLCRHCAKPRRLWGDASISSFPGCLPTQLNGEIAASVRCADLLAMTAINTYGVVCHGRVLKTHSGTTTRIDDRK